MKTHDKGEQAQLKVELRALEKGMIVSKPTRHESRYDCIIDDNGKLLRIQVKFASGIDKRNPNSVRIELRKVHKNGILHYSTKEIDLVLAYIPQVDKVLAFGPEHFEHRDVIYVKIKEGIESYSNWFEDFIW